jgi:hypothetical protein
MEASKSQPKNDRRLNKIIDKAYQECYPSTHPKWKNLSKEEIRRLPEPTQFINQLTQKTENLNDKELDQFLLTFFKKPDAKAPRQKAKDEYDPEENKKHDYPTNNVKTKKDTSEQNDEYDPEEIIIINSPKRSVLKSVDQNQPTLSPKQKNRLEKITNQAMELKYPNHSDPKHPSWNSRGTSRIQILKTPTKLIQQISNQTSSLSDEELEEFLLKLVDRD